LAFNPALKTFIETKVENIWTGFHFRLEDLQRTPVAVDTPVKLSRSIVQIAKNTRPADTALNTCGQQSGLQAMSAERALVCRSGIVIDKTGFIGTGLNTIGAAYAAITVDQHSSVLTLNAGTDRADTDAGWVIAMIAETR
jgi:hypothetical protein